MFAGEFYGHPELVNSCDCELRYGEDVVAVVDIEDEQIVKKANLQNKMRALVAVKIFELTKEEAESGNWELVQIDVD